MERAHELATDMPRTANGIVYEQRKRAELCGAECRQQYQCPKVLEGAKQSFRYVLRTKRLSSQL